MMKPLQPATIKVYNKSNKVIVNATLCGWVIKVDGKPTLSMTMPDSNGVRIQCLYERDSLLVECEFNDYIVDDIDKAYINKPLITLSIAKIVFTTNRGVLNLYKPKIMDNTMIVPLPIDFISEISENEPFKISLYFSYSK